MEGGRERRGRERGGIVEAERLILRPGCGGTVLGGRE